MIGPMKPNIYTDADEIETLRAKLVFWRVMAGGLAIIVVILTHLAHA